MLVKKAFKTTTGEEHINIPYDRKTKQWVYGVTWEEIGRVMEVVDDYHYNIYNRDAAKIVINLGLGDWTDEEIKNEIEIYIATYDSLDNYLEG